MSTSTSDDQTIDHLSPFSSASSSFFSSDSHHQTDLFGLNFDDLDQASIKLLTEVDGDDLLQDVIRFVPSDFSSDTMGLEASRSSLLNVNKLGEVEDAQSDEQIITGTACASLLSGTSSPDDWISMMINSSPLPAVNVSTQQLNNSPAPVRRLIAPKGSRRSRASNCDIVERDNLIMQSSTDLRAVRKAKNRVSAKKSREKKEREMEALKAHVKEINEEKEILNKTVQSLRAESERLISEKNFVIAELHNQLSLLRQQQLPSLIHQSDILDATNRKSIDDNGNRKVDDRKQQDILITQEDGTMQSNQFAQLMAPLALQWMRVVPVFVMLLFMSGLVNQTPAKQNCWNKEKTSRSSISPSCRTYLFENLATSSRLLYLLSGVS